MENESRAAVGNAPKPAVSTCCSTWRRRALRGPVSARLPVTAVSPAKLTSRPSSPAALHALRPKDSTTFTRSRAGGGGPTYAEALTRPSSASCSGRSRRVTARPFRSRVSAVRRSSQAPAVSIAFTPEASMTTSTPAGQVRLLIRRSTRPTRSTVHEPRHRTAPPSTWMPGSAGGFVVHRIGDPSRKDPPRGSNGNDAAPRRTARAPGGATPARRRELPAGYRR